MNELLLPLISVLGLIGLASIVAPRVGLPPPVLMVIAGIVWGLFPFLPPLEIEPHVVLSVFLPPLLYAEAWGTSWHDFRRWLRPILSLAIGLVAFTILCVGVVAKADAGSAMGSMLPHRRDPLADRHRGGGRRALAAADPAAAMAIVGGESLINDATGLLGVQLAMIVVFTGVFEAGAIAVDFARIAGLGIVSGVAVGLLAVALNARLRGTAVLFVFSLLAPYAGLRGGGAARCLRRSRGRRGGLRRLLASRSHRSRESCRSLRAPGTS